MPRTRTSSSDAHVSSLDAQVQGGQTCQVFRYVELYEATCFGETGGQYIVRPRGHLATSGWSCKVQPLSDVILQIRSLYEFHHI